MAGYPDASVRLCRHSSAEFPDADRPAPRPLLSSAGRESAEDGAGRPVSDHISAFGRRKCLRLTRLSGPRWQNELDGKEGMHGLDPPPESSPLHPGGSGAAILLAVAYSRRAGADLPPPARLVPDQGVSRPGPPAGALLQHAASGDLEGIRSRRYNHV